MLCCILEPDMDRFGAIDVGSNSIKLTVAESTGDGGFDVILTAHRVPQLARATAGDGTLDAAAMDRAVEAITDLLESAGHLEVVAVRVVATQAVRAAPNAADFIRRVREECGVELDVLDAEQEARSSWNALCRDQDVGDGSSVLIDVGGGSAECLLAMGRDVESVVSLPLGALQLTERFGLHDRIDAEAWASACAHVRSVIDQSLPRPATAPYAWAVGGTCTALVELDRLGIGLEEGGDLVPASESWAFTGLACDRIDAIVDALRHWSLAEREQATAVDEARAAILPAGGLVVRMLLSRFGVSTGCCVTRHGVRDGVLQSMVAGD
jgi:exopolyphosphatase/guanosine-5'-triphosphate,3'-diphosphate pyrophosphatase